LQHIAWTLTLALFQDQPGLAAARVGLRLAKGEALPLPIFVPLSAYAQHRRSLSAPAAPEMRTLAYFISHYLIDKQSTLKLPTDFFTRLLNAGQAVLLLLDGLDEVPDDDLRAEVSGAIEDLVLGKERLRVVATCRTVAYKDRTVLGRGFREVQVRPLAAEHIERLVTQAYAAIHPADADAQRDKRTLLLDGIRSLEAERQRRLGKEAEPLVTSPLLVRLLLIVQENERRLPDQRAELYVKATDNLLLPDYLLDRDAANRLGRLIQDKETHRELVQHLAYHMHQRGEQQGRDIDEDQLRQVFAGSRYAGLASDLIKITRLRGTLLEERNRRYRFIHLSFQEFLAARYLAEVVRDVDGIARFLEAGPVLESWWREPALLVIGYLSKASPHTAQELLRRLAGVDAEARARNVALTADVQMAAATVAETAFREWSPWQVGEAALKQELVSRLLFLFQDSTLTTAARPTWRAAVGDSLARLDDPRVEATTIEGMAFCYVPAGPFKMGEGKELHACNLDYAYWMGRYPVTNAQYAAFVAAGGYDVGEYWPEAAA
ncbi:MAG: NACHT domain-containing protein, partial [Anaerolineae bacterium]